MERTKLGERVLRVFNSAETGYEKPHPEAYRRVLRTLGDEVEAVRRVIRTGREEVRVPELCFSHGDQEKSAEAVTTESRPVSPCRSQEKPWRKT